VKASHTRRSVVTGSSAYADDDDREYGNRLKLAPMGSSLRMTVESSGSIRADSAVACAGHVRTANSYCAGDTPYVHATA
jgi:hypothetical protein